MQLVKNKKFEDLYKDSKLRHNLGYYPIPEDSCGSMAIDIGCNNGCFLNSFAQFFHRIHAYEANYFLVQKLKEKFTQDHISIYHNAVSDEDNKKLKLLSHESMEDGSFAIKKSNVRPDWEGQDFVCEVESISLESIMEKAGGHVGYMKIDCETSEYELLMNKDLSNIDYIALELHDQLGYDKYNELYDFICETHLANQSSNFTEHQHQEILFKNKNK